MPSDKKKKKKTNVCKNNTFKQIELLRYRILLLRF